jgi:hypothetical protein
MEDFYLKTYWIARSHWDSLDRESTPMMDEQQRSTKSQVESCLEKGVFRESLELQWYSSREDREPLMKITLKKVEDDDDLVYLLRFPEVEELTLPVEKVTYRGYMMLSGLPSLKKLTLIVPRSQNGSAKASEKGLQELKNRLPCTEVVFQLKS